LLDGLITLFLIQSIFFYKGCFWKPENLMVQHKQSYNRTVTMSSEIFHTIGLREFSIEKGTVIHERWTCFSLFFLWWYWGLNSGPFTCLAGTLHLNHASALFALVIFLGRVSHIFCLGWP
jgi:hypothetical protein